MTSWPRPTHFVRQLQPKRIIRLKQQLSVRIRPLRTGAVGRHTEVAAFRMLDVCTPARMDIFTSVNGCTGQHAKCGFSARCVRINRSSFRSSTSVGPRPLQLNAPCPRSAGSNSRGASAKCRTARNGRCPGKKKIFVPPARVSSRGNDAALNQRTHPRPKRSAITLVMNTSCTSPIICR